MVVNPKSFCLKPSESSWGSQDSNTTGKTHFLIRTAQTDDLTELAEILADSFHSRTGIGGWAYPLLRLGIYEDLRNRLRSPAPHYACLVAVQSVATITGDREELVGTVELALRSPPYWQLGSSQYPYISNLAVKRSHRRQGAAQQMLLSCERTAREWGFSDLYLHVLENNHSAGQLYRQLGYQVRSVDSSLGTWFLGQPKRLFLHKHSTLAAIA